MHMLSVPNGHDLNMLVALSAQLFWHTVYLLFHRFDLQNLKTIELKDNV